MAFDPTYQLLSDTANIQPFGMQRRNTPPSYLDANGNVLGTQFAQNVAAQDQPAPAPVYNPATDPSSSENPNNTRSSLQRGVTATGKGLQRDYYATKGAIEQAAGDQADAAVAKQKAQEYATAAEQLGPKINSLSQVHNVGDALSYAAGQAPGALTNLGLVAAGTVLGGGVGDAVLGGVGKAAGETAAGEALAGDTASLASKTLPSAARTAGQITGGAAAMYPGAVANNLAALDDPQSTDDARTRAGKVLAGAGVSALLLSAPYDRLLGVGGSTVTKQATSDISKATEKYLPRVIKGAATQGVVMGGANALATATTLATHKWVNNNVGVLTPQAFDQYLDAFKEGGVAGALFGGGKEALHGIPMPQFDSKHLDVLRKIGAAAAAKFGKGEDVDGPTLHPAAADLLHGLHSNLTNPEARTAVENAFATHYKDLHDDFDTDPNTAATQLATRSFTQALDDAKSPEAKSDIMAAYGKALDTGESAADQFKQHVGNLQNDTDIPPATRPQPVDQRPQDNPVQLKTPLENLLAAYIPHNHPLWAFPDTVKGMARSASKLFTGDDLSAKDQTNLDLWRRIVGPEQVKAWREAGPEYAALTKTTEHVDSLPEPDTAIAHAYREAQRTEAANTQETSDPSELDGEGNNPGEEAAAAEPDLGVNVTPGLKPPSLAQRVDAEPPGPARDALIAQLKDQVDRAGALITENRSSPKSAALWTQKDPTTHANTVGIEPKQVGTTRSGELVMRRQALQLDNLISRKLAEDPGIGAKAALMEVLGDIQSAGHTIDPKTITRGVYYTGADGRQERLTARQALDIRRSLGSGEKLSPKNVPEPAPRQPTDQLAPTSAEIPTVRDNSLLRNTRARIDEHPNAPLETVQERITPHPSDAMGADAALFDPDTKLGAHEPPPGSPREITSTGDVLDAAQGNARVSLRGSPYEALVNRTRRQVELLKTPAQRAATKHAAGVEIGTKELAKEQANGTISDKRLATEMARLHDYSSGSSRKYLYDAANGKYDSASYHEVSQDTNKPSGEQDDRDLAIGFQEAAKPQGPHDHAKETRMANALLHAVSVDAPVKVQPLDPAHAGNKGGENDQSTNTIRINQNLHGPERIDVLTHEIGHHIVNTEIGKLIGKSAHEVATMHEDELFGERNAEGERSGGLLAQHAPELHAALMKDYNEWVGNNRDASAKVSDVLASRKPFFRGESIKSRSTGEIVADLMARDGGFGDYLYSTHEWLADNISKVLTQGERSQTIIGKFFGTIADKLKAVYAKLFGTPEGAKYAPAPSVKEWVERMYARTTSDASAALERTVAHEEGIAAIKAAMHTTLGTGTEAGRQAFSQFYHYQLGPTERRVLTNALNRRTVMRQLAARYGHDAELMQRLEDPTTSEATSAHLAYKMWTRGELKLGAHPTEIMRGLKSALLRVIGVATGSDTALKLFEDIKNGEVQRQNADGKLGYDLRGRLVEGARHPEVQKAFNAAYTMGRQYIYDPWRKYGFGAGENAEKSATPGLSAIAALIKRHTGEAGEDPGMLPTSVRRRQTFYHAAGQAFEGLSKEQKTQAHQHMQRRTYAADIADPKVRASVTAQRALFARTRDYAIKAGVPLREIENYYPVQMDRDAVKKDPEGFASLLNQPHFEKGIRDYFSDDNGKPSDAPLPELIGKLHRYATGDDFGEGAAAPASAKDLGRRSSAEKRRVLDFIYKDGTPADVEKFIGYQEKNPQRVLTSHIDSIVRRAESVRRFGVNGEKLQEMIDEARKQHASDEDIQNTLDYVAAATGRFATDGSPFVRKVFDKLGKPEVGKKVNKALFGPKGQAVQNMIMAYQNARVLPLALLSSLSDPMGIGVRYGGWKSLGDVHAFFKSFKDGLVATSGGQSMQHLRALGDAIGMADDYINTEILSNGFGAEGMSGFARKMSDAMFKYNGMSWFTRGTRYMALALGQHFLLKHAGGAEPGANGSARYLRELGVQAGDIKPGEHGGVKLLNDMELEKASPAEREADARVRTALSRFVDEAVLRTDASQHPLFMNDPAFRLVTQYKQFTYAFGDQILGRIRHELHYTNLHVLGPALAYLPITMAAEMLRGFAQYGPGGNPNQQQWTPAEYSAFIWQRSGLGGPRATQMVKGFEHESQGYADFLPDLGPTAAQLEDITHTLEGKRSVAKTAVESLPASTLYQHQVMQ